MKIVRICVMLAVAFLVLSQPDVSIAQRPAAKKSQLSSGALNAVSRKPLVCNSSTCEVAVALPNYDVKENTYVIIRATPDEIHVTATIDQPGLTGVYVSSSKKFKYPSGKSFKGLLNVINRAKLTRTRPIDSDGYELTEGMNVFRKVNGKEEICFSVSHEPGNVNVTGNYASVVNYLKSCIPNYDHERIALSDILWEPFGNPLYDDPGFNHEEEIDPLLDIL